MAEFFELSADERLEALVQAADASGRPPHLLEKDVWVVWCLRHLFAAPYAPHLVFKGGTSLSKAYGVIQRFSEDVDLTYDIRAIAGDLIGDAGVPLPASKSQEKKWSKEIRARLADWVGTDVVPRLQQDLGQHGLPATVRAEGDKVFIDYTPLGWCSKPRAVPDGLKGRAEEQLRHEEASRTGTEPEHKAHTQGRVAGRDGAGGAVARTHWLDRGSLASGQHGAPAVRTRNHAAYSFFACMDPTPFASPFWWCSTVCTHVYGLLMGSRQCMPAALMRSARSVLRSSSA